MKAGHPSLKEFEKMSLQRILDAESVVIVGAFRDVTKRGYQAVKTLLSDRYEGRIYLVNP